MRKNIPTDGEGGLGWWCRWWGWLGGRVVVMVVVVVGLAVVARPMVFRTGAQKLCLYQRFSYFRMYRK